MTIVRAASSAMLSVVSAPRRAAALREVVHLEAEAQEVARREAVLQEVRLRETLAVAAVVPPVMMTMITTHRAAVAEGEGDSFLVTKPTKLAKLFFNTLGATARNRLPLLTPTKVGL